MATQNLDNLVSNYPPPNQFIAVMKLFLYFELAVAGGTSSLTQSGVRDEFLTQLQEFNYLGVLFTS